MTHGSVNAKNYDTARFLGRVQDMVNDSLARLSSGKRIIAPSDDSEGIGLMEKVNAEQKRIRAASTNVQNAASYIQSADGLLSSMGRMVSRLSELALLATDSMKNPGDIALYQTEFTQIQEQLRVTIGGTPAQIGGTAPVAKPLGSFNGIVLFGPNPTGLVIATGSAPDESITIPEANLRDGPMLEIFRQNATGDFLLRVDSPDAVAKITSAIQDLADERGRVGAVSRRFEMAAKTLTKKDERFTATLSEIGDVDIATESTRLARLQFLSSGAASILAQAIQSPRSVLKLLEES